MYDFNDIETMLRNEVATPEEIAKAFTDQLNAAIEATTQPTEWEKGIADLVDDWNYMIDLYVEEHPDETKDWDLGILHIGAKTMEDLIMASLDSYRMADNLVNSLNQFKKRIKENELNEKDDFKDVMRDFFKEIGL